MKVVNLSKALLTSFVAGLVIVGCAAPDTDPDVVVSPNPPSNTTVIEDKDPDVVVTPPPPTTKTDVTIDKTDDTGSSSTTTTTTGG